ncbi:MAG: 2-C-methyl-D-erythritol 4-phosphate cytidylyltransferase [Xanthomonadales bacterium]|nr:2-C-methyl-D-erythritol 4-phosphate cytidylyltransferase [Xanthomonadales bacterium]
MAASETGLWCVVPAAGRGRRFDADRPKQHIGIAGKSLLTWTLERLAAHPRIAGFVVVLAADDPLAHARIGIFGKPALTVIGGAERADSVLAGLRGLPDTVADAAFVLVHDAARPCVRHADIDALIDRGMPAGGGLLAAPVRDTLKRADANGFVLETEPREARWRAMTPQMFRRAELTAALESARRDGVIVSDEAMAMERAAFKPLLVECSDDNIKVTTPADYFLVEYFLLRDSKSKDGK